MPKITYDEFRPGHWVKKVDGEVVGPATAAEVAAWKQEKAAPASIWEDVVATASRPPLGEVATASRPPLGEIKVAKPPAVKAGAPAQPRTPNEPDQSTIWDDLVKRSKPSVQAEGPPRPHPRQEDTDQAEQGEIWQDVVKRAKKPERQPAERAPISPTTASEVKSEPATRPSLAPTALPAKPVHPTPPAQDAGWSTEAARPEAERTSAKKAFAAEITSGKAAAKALQPAVEAKVEEKTAPVRKAPDAKPAPKPTPPAKPTAKAAAKPRRGHAPTVPTVKATPQRPVAKAPQKARAAVKVAPARTTAEPRELAEPAARDRLPAKLLDEIAEEERKPATAPAEEAAVPAGRRGVSPPLGREQVRLSSGRKRAGPKPKSSPAAVSRRTTGKGKAAPAQERPNQLYLWISAGQADDLIAAVRTGLARYQERFSHVAEVVLCHSVDLPTLEGAKLPVDLREGKSLAPRNFWIGSK